MLLTIVSALHSISKRTNHEKVASLVDLQCLGQENAKIQSCNVARPAM
jgi:hypothetical protein